MNKHSLLNIYSTLARKLCTFHKDGSATLKASLWVVVLPPGKIEGGISIKRKWAYIELKTPPIVKRNSLLTN